MSTVLDYLDFLRGTILEVPASSCVQCGHILRDWHEGPCPRQEVHAAVRAAAVQFTVVHKYGSEDGPSIIGNHPTYADAAGTWTPAVADDVRALPAVSFARLPDGSLPPLTRGRSVGDLLATYERLAAHLVVPAELRGVVPDEVDGGAYGIGQMIDDDGNTVPCTCRKGRPCGNHRVVFVRAVAEPGSQRATALPMVSWRTRANDRIDAPADQLSGPTSDAVKSARQHAVALADAEGYNLTTRRGDQIERTYSRPLTAEGAVWLHLVDGTKVPAHLVEGDRQRIVGAVDTDRLRKSTVRQVVTDWEFQRPDGTHYVTTRARGPLATAEWSGTVRAGDVPVTAELPHTARLARNTKDLRTSQTAAVEVLTARAAGRARSRVAAGRRAATALLEGGEIRGRSDSMARRFAEAALVVAALTGSRPVDLLS